MAFDERKYTSDEWKSAKKQLQNNGFYHAIHWQKRRGVLPDWLRNYASKDHISALRCWIGGTPKLYYHKDAVDVVCKSFGL